MLTLSFFERFVNLLDTCPWATYAGRLPSHHYHEMPARPAPLYTTEERKRRDDSGWTTVQGVLAPVQFAVFLISISLVLRFLSTGDGADIASASIVVKTLVLYTIMVTGAIWEKEVFGRYLFARAFFWEDVFSMLVLALHTAYLATLFVGTVDVRAQMYLALSAYAAYAINAAQFVVKLRMARREGSRHHVSSALRMS